MELEASTHLGRRRRRKRRRRSIAREITEITLCDKMDYQEYQILLFSQAFVCANLATFNCIVSSCLYADYQLTRRPVDVE